MTDLEIFQIQLADAEKALRECHAAFELVPVESLEKGLTWHPSEVAVLLLKKAKGSVVDYGHAHWNIDEKL